MTSSPGEGYGQLKIDPTREGWGVEELLIATYFTASGFHCDTVSLIITIMTGNETIEGYHVSEEMMKSLRGHPSLYDNEHDAFDLRAVGEYLAYNMNDKIAKNERISLWERLTRISRREKQTIEGEGESMVQRQCYGKEMTEEEVRKELEDSFLADIDAP